MATIKVGYLHQGDWFVKPRDELPHMVVSREIRGADAHQGVLVVSANGNLGFLSPNKQVNVLDDPDFAGRTKIDWCEPDLIPSIGEIDKCIITRPQKTLDEFVRELTLEGVYRITEEQRIGREMGNRSAVIEIPVPRQDNRWGAEAFTRVIQGLKRKGYKAWRGETLGDKIIVQWTIVPPIEYRIRDCVATARDMIAKQKADPAHCNSGQLRDCVKMGIPTDLYGTDFMTFVDGVKAAFPEEDGYLSAVCFNEIIISWPIGHNGSKPRCPIAIGSQVSVPAKSIAGIRYTGVVEKIVTNKDGTFVHARVDGDSRTDVWPIDDVDSLDAKPGDEVYVTMPVTGAVKRGLIIEIQTIDVMKLYLVEFDDGNGCTTRSLHHQNSVRFVC